MILKEGYSTEKALIISRNYRIIDGFYNKCTYIAKQHGVKLIIKDKRFWFEYYGKQVTPTDLYISKSIKDTLSSVLIQSP